MVWDIKVHVFRKAVRRVSGMCALHRKEQTIGNRLIFAALLPPLVERF